MLERKDHGKAVDWYLLGVLLYEMLVGVPPHFAKSPNEVFEKITSSSVKIPTKLSEDAKSLLSQVGSANQLLQHNPTKRLGSSEKDAEEIKAHPFFADIDWTIVPKKLLEPPQPKIKKLIPYLFSDEILRDSDNHHVNEHMDNWSFIVDGF